MGKSPTGSRQPGWGDSNSSRLLKWCLVAAGWRADLRFLGTGCDRWCPLHSPICRSRVYLACTAATSADGAGMLWAKVTHGAPDEGSGFGGRRVCLRLPRVAGRPDRNPRPSMPRPSQTTFPSRNSSSSEAVARSLVPKVIALASVTNGTGPAVAMDEDVVASAVLSSFWVLQPAADAVRILSRTTCFISHRTTTRIVLPPHASFGT